MCSHSSDLKLDWIQEGVACLCLKEEGRTPWYWEALSSLLEAAAAACCGMCCGTGVSLAHLPAWFVEHSITAPGVQLLVSAASFHRS